MAGVAVLRVSLLGWWWAVAGDDANLGCGQVHVTVAVAVAAAWLL